MFSRITASVAALVIGVSAIATTGCAGAVGDGADMQDSSATTAATKTTTQALDGGSLFDTVQQLGQKAGPALSAAGFLYGLYTNVPGKLDAMNAKLDVIAGDTAAIKAQLAVIDAKMDDQFKAEFLGPMGTAENYISIDMKNLMTTLQSSQGVDEGTWNTTANALDSQIQATDTASETVLSYFAPTDAVASKWTATQWFRVYGYYLRASLVKIALRDAEATLASTYYGRSPTADWAARKQTAVANLVSTVQQVTPVLRRIGDFYVTARDIPGLMKQTCFQNGTYRNILGINPFVGVIYNDDPYESFRDPGAQYTSQQYVTSNQGDPRRYSLCAPALMAYREDMSTKVADFVKTSIDAPIATITGVPATWAGK